MDIYFTDHFDVLPDQLEEHGAFNVSLVADLPLFVDPFLLFNSDNEVYQSLHQDIINYLVFLRDRSSDGMDEALMRQLYAFPEVRQNWFGFTESGNHGGGLGMDFAQRVQRIIL